MGSEDELNDYFGESNTRINETVKRHWEEVWGVCSRDQYSILNFKIVSREKNVSSTNEKWTCRLLSCPLRTLIGKTSEKKGEQT